MLKEHHFIYLAPEKWAGLWRNRQQLMSVFARDNTVLFIEPPTFSFRLAGQSLLRRQVGLPNLYVFRFPPYPPLSGRFPLERIFRIARRHSLIQALKKLDMQNPILWLSRPYMVERLAEIPRARLLVYHVVDEYAGYAGLAREQIQRLREQEKRIFSLADIVVVTSKKLYETKSPFHPRTYLVPNAANYEAYSEALRDPRLPEALAAIPPPRLGYSGLIGDKLDLEMLLCLAKAHPQWSLVFLGEARFVRPSELWPRLLSLPNVHYLGQVEISKVPHYVKGFQAGLIPYRQNLQAENISPLKLYDYLAAGIPVASIDIPAAREFKGHLHIAENPLRFPEIVEAALGDTSPERILARRDIAAQNTWEARGEQISSIILTTLRSE